MHLLAFDDNHTVGTFFTIENGGGSILQHIHTLYVEHVEVIEFLHGYLHSVKNYERVVHSLFAFIGYQ